MEQITRRNGVFYYGDRPCKDADEVYCLFRNDYHKSLGKANHFRLNRIGSRKERVHGQGIFLTKELEDSLREFDGLPKVKCRIMGIVETAYSRMVCLEDMPDISEEKFERYLLWLFRKGGNTLYYVGRRDRVGRTRKIVSRRNRYKF